LAGGWFIFGHKKITLLEVTLVYHIRVLFVNAFLPFLSDFFEV